MKKILLFISLVTLLFTVLCGCSSKTPENTIPTIDQTVKSRNGDKVLFFDGEEEETICTTMDSFNNIYFKLENGTLYVALEEDGQYYRTTFSGIDGFFIDVRNADEGFFGDLYVFRGKRIMYKITFYTEGYEPFKKEDLDKGFGKLTPVK